MRIIFRTDLTGREYAAAYGSSFPRSSVLGRIEQRSIEQAMAPIPRWYGVSTGDGNNGVSHMFPDYYVFTGDPWRLAEKAAQACIKPQYHDDLTIDGEADYTIFAELPSEFEDGYCVFILHVFPADLDDIGRHRSDPWGLMCYASIQEALGE